MLRGFKLKHALALAWPISLQGMLTNFISIVDVAMVSHLGDSAIAAVGLGNRYQFMLMVILLGCAWTVGVLSAQYYGAEQTSRIRSTIVLACAVALLGLLPVALLTWFWSINIIGLATNNIDVIQLGSEYINITVPSLAFVAVILVYENAIRSLGHTKLPLIMSAVAIALNIALNYWFIHGGLGLPAMGVLGAALATAAARLIQLLLLISFIHINQHPLRTRLEDFRPNRKEAWKIISMAAPMMGSFGVWAVGIFVYQLIYGNMGTTELAIIAMLTPVEAIFLALFFGLSSACSISIGQRLGANDFTGAIVQARVFIMLNISIAVLLGIVLTLCAPLVLAPFASSDTGNLAYAHKVLILMALLSWLKVSNMTLAMGVLRAGGDNRIVMLIDVVGMWFIGIPLTAAAALIWHWPLLAVVAIAYSEELSKVILFAWRVLQKHWLKNLSLH
ncbi:MATE family efflux transporter [Agaribacterium sp. ZY112]|uniref:MATE family efflux transporter n=1 Tax=Agaribacterium sp. ZY112 TaxID=3233574 RepID=UPI0035239BCB